MTDVSGAAAAVTGVQPAAHRDHRQPGEDPGDQQAWRDAWHAALDDLELTLVSTEQLLAGEQAALAAANAAWVPPVIPAPLPDDMLARAQALLGRQQAVIARTSAALSSTRRQLGVTERLGADKPAARPVYVDLTA